MCQIIVKILNLYILYHHSFHYLSITCNAFIGCYIRRMKYIFLLMYNLEVWKRFLIKKIVYDPMLNFVTVYIVETNIDHSRWSEKESFRWDYIKKYFSLAPFMQSKKSLTNGTTHNKSIFYLLLLLYSYFSFSLTFFSFLIGFPKLTT